MKQTTKHTRKNEVLKMKTADIYTAKNVYTWMLNEEICLVTTKKNLHPAQISAIAIDFSKVMKWIDTNDKTLTKQDAMYYIAWDWSVTIAVIKDILQTTI